MKRAGVLSIVLLMYLVNNAQSVKGVLVDPVEGGKVSGATVELRSAADTTKTSSTFSDAAGNFIFNGVAVGQYLLRASSVGFEFLQRPVTVTDSVPNLDLGEVYLPKKTVTLEGVVVVSSPPATVQVGDTTQYSASQFKVNPDATVEDLVKKMPGVTVDRTGTITAQGEQVRKVTVDGKDFFGDDATAAMRNLPADVVDKIQVFDRLSDQAQLTGFDDGNSQRSINIVTKSGVRNGQFGRIYAGYGTDDRYQAGGNISFFSGDRRISLVGNFNNVNQQNFASQDLLGVTSSGGGGRGGGRGGGFGGGNNFMVGQSPGINRTTAFGINYGDKWGEKLNVTGSYFFNNRKSTNQSFTNRVTTYAADSVLNESSKYTSTSEDYNHRFNLRFEYKLDSNNTIYYIPSLSFQNNNSGSDYWSNGYFLPNDSTNTSRGTSESLRKGYNINNMLMFRHAFAKRGRTLFLSLNASNSKNDGYSISDEFTRTFYPNFIKDSVQNQKSINNSNTNRYSGRIGYTEPLGKKGMLEFNYNASVQKSSADNQAYLFDGNEYTIPQPRLSNLFDNTIITNSAGINYRLGQSRDNQLSFGVDFQNSKLQSDRVLPNTAHVDQSFNNFLPNFRWMKKIGRYSNMRVFYRANTDFPSVNQLQDVPNTSNMLRPSVGNPNLKQSYSHLLSGRYTYTNTRNNNVFIANVSARTTEDYISSATYLVGRDSTIEQGVVITKNAQLSKPVNLNGYRNFSSFLTFGTTIKPIKSNININLGGNYVRRPGLINYRNTITENYSYSGGLGLSSNISEYIDYNFSYNINFNNVISNANASSNNKYINQAIGLQFNLLSKNGWFLQNDLSNQNYTGLSVPGSQNYWLWNAGVGKKFLKKRAGELKLSVFDLLKQNQSIGRTIGDNYFEDSQNMVLQQYFMLTFTYSLKNFGKGRTTSRGNEDRRNEWRERGGGMPGGGPMF